VVLVVEVLSGDQNTLFEEVLVYQLSILLGDQHGDWLSLQLWLNTCN